MPDIVKIALWYRKHGLSVFPIIPPRADSQGKDMKKPACKWEEFQKRIATEQEIQDWWTKHPDNRIGIATGKISDILVIDCDDEEAHLKMQECMGDIKTPVAKSPHGWHYYFKHVEGVRNKVRLQDIAMDVRAEGGFIMAPPSAGLNGSKYEWITNPAMVQKVEVPSSLLSLILSFNSTKYIYSTIIANSGPNSPLNFEQGSRDHTIFHIANCLVKGGMPTAEVKQLLELIASNLCNPPFDAKEVQAKIQSALNRAETSERNITEEVREWALSTTDHWMSTDIYKDLGLSTRAHKKAVSIALARLCENGLIERFGNKRGNFRTVDRNLAEQCWWNDDGAPLGVRFPLDVHEFAKVYQGNIILLEGQKSQGKSAFALEFCRLNKALYPQKILYQNVEMADSELLERFRAYGDVMSLDEWRQAVTFIRQTTDWWDKIQPDGLNVIDYLVEYSEPWRLAQYVFNIHQKLKTGIALVIVQRDPFKPYPAGGRAVRDIPRVIMSLIKHKLRLEDVKSFYQTDYGNPSGLVREYKQANWWQFKAVSGWDHEEEAKYAAFRR